MKFWKKKEPSLTFEANFPRPRQRSVRLNEVIAIISFIVGIFTYTIPYIGLQVWQVCLIGAALLSSYSSMKKGGGKSNYLKNLEQNGHLVNTKQASDPIKVIYGKYRIGGNWVFAEGKV